MSNVENPTNRKNIALFIIPLCVLVLTSCSAPLFKPHWTLNEPRHNNIDAIMVIDERTEEARAWKMNIFTWRDKIGDESFDPPLLTIFEKRINQKLGAQLAGSIVRISSLEVRRYTPSAYFAGLTVATGGGILIPATAPALIGKEKMGNWLICHIEGTIDGKPFDVTHKERGMDGASGKQFSDKIMSGAITNTINKSIAQIAKLHQ